MKVRNIYAAVGSAGWYCDDKAAIHQGAVADGYAYRGRPVTPGFSSVREPGQALCIVLETDASLFAYGDCVSVTYAGQAGRREVFNAGHWKPLVEKEVAPVFVGRELGCCRSLCAELDSVIVAGKRLHPAVQYGLSQALLNAVALAYKRDFPPRYWRASTSLR